MSWAEELEAAAGSRIVARREAGGGDVHQAYAVDLADGRRVFVKEGRGAPLAMYQREAAGLRWLAEAGALRVPAIVAVGADFLAIERIEPARPKADYDETLGRGLALLHRSGAPSHGWREDNYVGSLAQCNEPCADWASFYAERRLRAQLDLARAKGRAASLGPKLERLLAKLPALIGASEPPARLHGDLWGGNVLTDERGAPVLIDPSVYGGSREIDLAMLQLFGGLSARALDAYQEAFPLLGGWRERVRLYQIYPLLVHVNLFGGSYITSAEQAIQSYL